MVYSKKTTIIIYRQPRIGTMQLFSASGYVPTHAARKRLSIECHQWWLSWHLLVGHIDDVLPLNRVIVILPSYYSNVVLSSCSAPKHHLAALQWNTALHQLRIALPPFVSQAFLDWSPLAASLAGAQEGRLQPERTRVTRDV